MRDPYRFPPPWTVDERPACFIVTDATGQALAYVYYEEEPGRRSAAKLMTHDEPKNPDDSMGITRLTSASGHLNSEPPPKFWSKTAKPPIWLG